MRAVRMIEAPACGSTAVIARSAPIVGCSRAAAVGCSRAAADDVTACARALILHRTLFLHGALILRRAHRALTLDIAPRARCNCGVALRRRQLSVLWIHRT